MAISKEDTVLTYSKFKEFWSSFAVLFNKKLDGGGIKNNDTTTEEGYVLDARMGKVHGDEIDTLKDQMNGCYIAYDSNGKLGIKSSKNGAVQSFRQPTGDAVAANVLVGKTFANKSSDSNTGTMPNNGKITKTLTPSGNNSTSYTIPAGYTSGGTITANGSTSYNAGVSAGKAAVGYGVEVFGGVGQYTNTNWTIPQTGKYRMTWLVHSDYTHSIYVYKGNTYYIHHEYEDGKNGKGLSGGNGDTGWLSFNKGDVLTIEMNGDTGQKNGIASILTITYVYGN